MTRNYFPTLSIELLLAAIFLLHVSCAKIGSPNGGPKDETAPQILSSQPTKGQTEYKEKELTIEFDEYVKLDNSSKVSITPFTNPPPKISTKGKSIVLTFEEELRTNMTYYVNFGEEIKDINEGNILKENEIIFSTGNKIDSTKLSGTVINSNDGKPVEKVYVGLYRSSDDTLFLKEAPLYLTSTDKSGNFTLNYLAEGKYDLVALEDKNSNFYFDLPNEKIAFQDQNIDLIKDSINNETLYLFELFTALKIISTKMKTPGKVEIELNDQIENWEYKTIIKEDIKDSLIVQISESKKELTIWYPKLSMDTINLELSANQIIVDTIEIIQPKDWELEPLKNTNSKPTRGKFTLSQNKELIIPFNYLIDTFDISKISIYDTKTSIKIQQDSLISKTEFDKIKLKANWDTLQYEIEILPNAITDFNSQTNQDTIKFEFLVVEAKEPGSLTLKFEQQDSSKQYIYKIMDSQEQLVEKGISTDSLTIPVIERGVYTIQVIVDENKNLKWDTGDYKTRRQPETIISIPGTIDIKSNWETEKTINLSEFN